MGRYLPKENPIEETFFDLLDSYLDRESVMIPTEVSASYTALASDYVINVTTGGAYTITLPAATEVPTGKVFIIKDISGGAGSNTITIAPNVDGGSGTITTNYGYAWIQSNGVTYGRIG